MKKIYLILLLLLSQYSFAQNSSKGIGRWKVGVNIGGSFQTADISTTLFGIGFGATLEYSFIENDYSLLGFSLRGRYLNARTYGNHYKLNSDPISNNNINGVIDNNFNYTNLALYQNNKTSLNEYSLEAMLKLNSLYQKTGVLFYVFAGGGLTKFKVKTNQLDNSGNLYDYSTIDNTKNKSDIQHQLNQLRNGDYETTLSNPDYKSVVFTPTTGIGLGYRIAPFFDIALEYKLALPQTPLFDGQIHKTNDPSFVQDIYHYASVNFIFHIVHHNYGTTYTPIDETYSTPITTETTIYQGSTTTTTTTPQTTPNNTTTGGIVTTPVGTNSGSGVSTTVIYQPHIFVTAPTASNYLSPNCTVKIKADITYVNSENDISFYQNGNKIPNYNFFYNQGVFTSIVELTSGNNDFKIIAINGNLSDTKEFTLNCNSIKKINICHNNPATHQKENIIINETDWNIHLSHGDVKGNCPSPVVIPIGTTVNTNVSLNDSLINICHHPVGSSTFENIKIKSSQWAMHQSHGDTKGFCKKNINLDPVIIGLNTDSITTENNDHFINICHHFKGTTSNISIRQSEWALHHAHGDTKGNCPTTPIGENLDPVIIDLNQEMITICHNISGQPGKVETISIPLNKWAIHQSHGDVKGKCRKINTDPIIVTIPDKEIYICHIISEKPLRYESRKIHESEWPMHQSHGDVKGKCSGDITTNNNGGISTNTNEPKIKICHNFNGKGTTMMINASDWSFHQAHGDIKGNCTNNSSNTGSSSGNSNGNNQKITICHIPPGNHSNPQTIQIPTNAWSAHKSHGDTKGACSKKKLNTTPKTKITPPKKSSSSNTEIADPKPKKKAPQKETKSKSTTTTTVKSSKKGEKK